ncbi:signal peptide peptidase SppA [Lusitaniella coriacea LEGE 07157]|uniref:Protease 4 n=1 Tax=Lusitaniella coriacea LEGE 07157 TaxID=945747 RepID=A0A8J7JB26_9CYAN|nr:signal peptide peptidase SppA [Lusitaniella coriacea]MBE9116625.1 signal peptide peptidase SppA [Lusitaniella coriacea LEGE 07157]
MRQFLKQTFASLVGTLVAVILLVALGTSSLVFLIVAAVSTSEEPSIKNKSVLVFDLSTSIRDTEPPVSLGEAVSGDVPAAIPLRQVLQNLEKATQDKRIVALFLNGSNGIGNTDYATLAEIRPALEQFRESGKKIIAYGVDWGEREYYLGSVADEVILNPMGIVEMNGLSSEQVFFSQALDKFGIGVQVIRVGRYKAAVEPFIQQTMSPENRQQIAGLLGDLWGEFIADVGTSRKIPANKLQALANTKGIFLASEAKAQGLVDRVAYFDEVAAELREISGKGDDEQLFRKVSLEGYSDISVKAFKQESSQNKIAIVYAEGAIVGGRGEDGQIGSARINEQLRDVREDEDVKAVVLRINSPGGSATASELILREIQLIRQEKPVIVSMGDVAASGGYWIATGADYIFAEPSTITGSIGVFGLLPNLEKISNDNGVAWEIVKTGQLADLDTVVRPKTPQELALYQRLVNQVYDLFLDKVAKSRNIPKEKVAQIAQGRIWSGQDAKQIGLVDELGGIESAIAYAAKKAELDEDWEAEEYLEEPDWERQLIDMLQEEAHIDSLTASNPFSSEFNKMKKDLAILQLLSDSKGVYALLPFEFRIK